MKKSSRKGQPESNVIAIQKLLRQKAISIRKVSELEVTKSKEKERQERFKQGLRELLFNDVHPFVCWLRSLIIEKELSFELSYWEVDDGWFPRMERSLYIRFVLFKNMPNYDSEKTSLHNTIGKPFVDIMNSRNVRKKVTLLKFELKEKYGIYANFDHRIKILA